MDIFKKLQEADKRRREGRPRKPRKNAPLSNNLIINKVDIDGRQYHIKTSEFCNLAKQKAWQDWLGEHHVKLQEELMIQLISNLGCRANSHKMIRILDELKKQGELPHVVEFLLEEFPSAIIGPILQLPETT